MNKLFTYFVLNIFLFLQVSAYGQDQVIVHTVEQGQTIYSISKLYSVAPVDIQNQNPLVDESFAIKPGQLLRIEVKKDEEASKLLSKLEKQPKIHVVQSKETLYGISKYHDVELDDLRDWNNLSDSQIKVAQELIVGWRYSNKEVGEIQSKEIVQPHSTVVVEEQPTKQIVQEQPVATKAIIEEAPTPTIVKQAEPKPRLVKTDKQTLLSERYQTEASTKSIFTESGPAIFFSTDNDMLSTRYYGLYSNAKVGSIIKVMNLINNRVVYVKVIGGLPDTKENHGSMIKLTTAAKNALASNDGKIRVEVTYAK